jgi:hypothetical protein
MEQLDGRSQTLDLPELTDEQLHDLADALEILRGNCSMSPRKLQGEHARIASLVLRGMPFDQLIDQLHGQPTGRRDVRWDIIRMPDQFFWRFMLLAYEVAQDSTICLKSLERVVKDFGLSS